MWRVWGRIEVCTGCWWGSLRERGNWGNLDGEGRIIKVLKHDKKNKKDLILCTVKSVMVLNPQQS
jgi:hypothetical protein